MMTGLKTVFSNGTYIFLATFLSFTIGFLLMISMGVIQVFPIYLVNTYNLLYQGTINLVTGLAFLFLVPIISAMTVSMIIYKVRELRHSAGKESSVASLGMVSGLFTSACVNCVPVVLLIFGVTYGTFYAFLSPLLIWVRVIALVVLSISFYLTAISISKICKNKRR